MEIQVRQDGMYIKYRELKNGKRKYIAKSEKKFKGIPVRKSKQKAGSRSNNRSKKNGRSDHLNTRSNFDIKGIKKSRWIDPYLYCRKNGCRSNIKLPYSTTIQKNVSGVYLIKNKSTGKIVYVGSSRTQLKKTIFRHFQKWEENGEKRKTYPKFGYKIRIILSSPSQAERLERYFIAKLNPKDNKNKYKDYFGSNANEQSKSDKLGMKVDTIPVDNSDVFDTNIDEPLPF